MALTASPLALLAFMLTSHLIRALNYPELLDANRIVRLYQPTEIIQWLPTAYIFGLFPTLYVLLTIKKSVRLNHKFRVSKVYLVSLILAVLPWLALTLMTGRIQGFTLVFASAISTSVSFFALLHIGKKLLAWAGAPLSEISPKAGTP